MFLAIESQDFRSVFLLLKTCYTVRKVLADFAVCDYCKALCDEKFSQIEGNGRKFRHLELSNSVIR